MNFLFFALALAVPGQEDARLRKDAAEALRRATTFIHKEVAVQGGYVWRVSEDLRFREGEGGVDESKVWVQPPGTPAIGLAFLDAYEATLDPVHLEAAKDAGAVMLRGQLRSGGWTSHIPFDPKDRARFAFRGDPKRRRQRNFSSLDDNTTQAALRFMMRLDQALDFKDEKIHEAVQFAGEALLKAQFPNGAFPQGFEGPVKAHPERKAAYPDSWSRTPVRGNDYWNLYTLNDDLCPDIVALLLDAERITGDERFARAAEKVGDFLILAQMPDPQPGWAQQYTYEMHPTWARKFEPPAITGWESQGAMETLMTLYRKTGDRKYLEPIPRALAYTRKSLLPDGRLARFYELKTNRPLYFTRDYTLTYDDRDVPRHYGFKMESRLDAIAGEYERVRTAGADGLKPSAPRLTPELAARAREAVDALDDRGRWIEPGRMRFLKRAPVERILDSPTFIRNVKTLCRYLRSVTVPASQER